MVRDKKQDEEWRIAQEINVSIDLISATKQHLNFLAAVDRNSSWLCQDGPALQKAIYRYTACWIPLLAKHTESPLFEGPLVVPLDCEWIWHCHRLNPITYKDDCQKLYCKILDNKNVVSTTQETSEKESENVWKNLYPNESFVLDPSRIENSEENLTEAGKFTKYDLTSSVMRQSSFFSQVSEPHMNNDVYLEGAIARYKGFLHLVKRNIEMDNHNFLAPTYDIDLIWHTHQLNPVSYSNDLENLLGMIVGHDDTVTDREKGKKLDVLFTRTINSWADMYGSRYRRAGAMHKFSAPTPSSGKDNIGLDEKQKIMYLPELRIMEVMLEFVNVKDLPEEYKGKQLFVSFSKTQPDALFMGKRMLAMFSEFEEPVASFNCQPAGKFLFELVVCSPSSKEVSHPSQTLGYCSISLEDLLLPKSGFMTEKWLELIPSPNCENSKPISLRMAISVTPPTPARLSLGLVRLAACLCTKACTNTIASPCGSPSDGKANPSGIPLDSDPFPCVVVSNLNACANVDGNTGSKPSATGSNGSACFATCVVISNANAGSSVHVIGDTGSKPSATGSNGGACFATCVVISNDQASGASSCAINCVGISKPMACDASACSFNCVVTTNSSHCDASACSFNCVVTTNSSHCDASACSFNCVATSNSSHCDASACSFNCVAISNSSHCDASACSFNCVVTTNSSHCDTSAHVRVTNDGVCDAKACNLVTGVDDCESKASLCGIPCA